jgi:4-hydroxy-2-oxoheptanedioate aldolase
MAGGPAVCPIREKVAAGETLYNAWISLGVPIGVELAADAGADLVTIDQQHGLGGNAEMLACLTAARAAGVPALVRVARNDGGLIGRALDAGAHGVICPMIDSAEDAQTLVGAVKYPPDGARSSGPFRAAIGKPDYISTANAFTIACGQIETRAGLDAADAILETPGLDMICAGPNDMALTLSNGAHRDIDAPEVREALDLLVAKCREKGVISAIYANNAAFAKAMIAKGWQVVALGTEFIALRAAAAAARDVIKG